MWLDGGSATAYVGSAGHHRRPDVHLVGTEVDDDVAEGRSPGSALPAFGRSFKRVVDVVAASLGLVATLPLVLLVAIAVRWDSRGPVLFRQVRTGLNGRQFTLFKFRSMVRDNDDSRHRAYVESYIRGEATAHDGMFKLVDDPRITRVGRWLRRTSLDELPQLWNVLRGDMSLVGPRPPLPGEVELYDDDAWQRLRVKPGLTGLWQVSGRCGLSFDEMVKLDVQYWQRWTPMLDVVILLKTPKTVLTGAGAA